MSGAGQGEYYLRLAADRYYNRDSEPPGQWLGRGAAALGLSGEVESSEFRNLLLGRSPDGKRDLVQNAGKASRCSGWDGTLSAPKEFSILFGVLPSDSDQRRQLLKAYERAVLETARWIEDQAGVTRRGRAGERQEPMALVVAAFRHSTSRSLDPAIHTHLLILNVGVRGDGSTGAFHSRRLYEVKMEAGRRFRRSLHKELRSLGLRAELNAGDRLVLPDVPQSLVKELSKRRGMIKRVMEERGWHSAEAAKVVTLATRPNKQEVRMEDLHKAWMATAREHGFTPERALSLFADRGKERASTQDRTVKPVVNTPSSPVNASVLPSPGKEGPGKHAAHAPQIGFWKSVRARVEVMALRRSRRLMGLPGLGMFLRIERRQLFPKAPSWSPFRKLYLPRLVLVRESSSTRAQSSSPWRYRVIARHPLGPLEIQLRERPLFPKSPEWSPFRHAKARSWAIQRKRAGFQPFPRSPLREPEPITRKQSRPFGLGL